MTSHPAAAGVRASTRAEQAAKRRRAIARGSQMIARSLDGDVVVSPPSM